jgi:hypothetical protein
LPEDFQQIKQVYVADSHFKQLVQRAPLSTNDGYWVKNNFIYTSHKAALTVEYIPVPLTLTFTRSPTELAYAGTPQFADYCEQLDRSIITSGSIVDIIDCATGKQLKRLTGILGTIRGVAITKKYIYVGTSSNLYIYSHDFTLLTTSTVAVEKIKRYNATQVLVKTPSSITKYIGNVATETVSGWCSEYIGGFLEETPANELIYHVLDDDGSEYTDDMTEYFQWTGLGTLIISDPYVFISDRKGIHCIHGFNRFEWNPNEYTGRKTSGKILAVNTNDVSGLGVIHATDDSIYRSGFTPDTVLDYPNNIFFDVLETRLAILLRGIVGIDTNLLLVVAQQYERDLEDFISRDTYQPVRIATSLSNSRFKI